jgi:hypothetical protein
MLHALTDAKIYGGTNWGNLGHPGVYTSYDYGSAIAEDRSIAREKYSELKLEANFLKVSPAYLTANPGILSSTLYTDNADLAVTPLIGNGSASNFYVLRHSDYSSLATTNYKLRLSTSAGNLTVPQLSGILTLNGRDSKIHVTDYDIGGTNLLYSTAEIFTWKKFDEKKVLVLYSGMGELHETAISTNSTPITIEGTGVTIEQMNGTVILNWQTSPIRRIVKVNDLFVYILGKCIAKEGYAMP